MVAPSMDFRFTLVLYLRRPRPYPGSVAPVFTQVARSVHRGTPPPTGTRAEPHSQRSRVFSLCAGDVYLNMAGHTAPDAYSLCPGKDSNLQLPAFDAGPSTNWGTKAAPQVASRRLGPFIPAFAPEVMR